MRQRRRRSKRSFLVQATLLVLGCTLTLTFSFFGVFAILSGEMTGIGNRLPFYVLGMAVVFVAIVVYMEEQKAHGRTIIASASSFGVTAFLVFTLGTEGLIYSAENPGSVMTSKQFLYVVAAGMITTGIGYWMLKHWDEVVHNSPRRSRSRS